MPRLGLQVEKDPADTGTSNHGIGELSEHEAQPCAARTTRERGGSRRIAFPRPQFAPPGLDVEVEAGRHQADQCQLPTPRIPKVSAEPHRPANRASDGPGTPEVLSAEPPRGVNPLEERAGAGRRGSVPSRATGRPAAASNSTSAGVALPLTETIMHASPSFIPRSSMQTSMPLMSGKSRSRRSRSGTRRRTERMACRPASASRSPRRPQRRARRATGPLACRDRRRRRAPRTLGSAPRRRSVGASACKRPQHLFGAIRPVVGLDRHHARTRSLRPSGTSDRSELTVGVGPRTFAV